MRTGWTLRSLDWPRERDLLLLALRKILEASEAVTEPQQRARREAQALITELERKI